MIAVLSYILEWGRLYKRAASAIRLWLLIVSGIIDGSFVEVSCTNTLQIYYQLACAQWRTNSNIGLAFHRSLLTQEGICITLDPEFHFLEVAYPYVARRLLTDEDPALRERLIQVLFQVRNFWTVPPAKFLYFLDCMSTHFFTNLDLIIWGVQDGKFQWKRLENLIKLAREGMNESLDLNDTLKVEYAQLLSPLVLSLATIE